MLKDSKGVLVANGEVTYLEEEGKKVRSGFQVGDDVFRRVTSEVSIFDDLRFFYGKHGTEKAVQIAGIAAGKGTRIHKIFEERFFESAILDPDWVPKLDQLANYLEERKMVPIVSEKRLYRVDGDMSFCGQFDALFGNPETRRYLLVDYKSGNFYNKSILQASMYSTTLEIILQHEHDNKDVKVDCLILGTGKEPDEEMDFTHTFNSEEMQETLEMCRTVCKAKNWNRQYKKQYKCFQKD